MLLSFCRYSKLAWLKKANIIAFNSALVRVFTFLKIAPTGIKDVHDMLVKVATSLIRGGETGRTDLFQSRGIFLHKIMPSLTSLRLTIDGCTSYDELHLLLSMKRVPS